MPDNINGSVYIFNTYTESLELKLNKIDIPTIAAAPEGDYAPPHISLERSAATSGSATPIFFSKANLLQVKHPYHRRPVMHMILLSPTKYPIEDDIYLYVSPDRKCMLVHENKSIFLQGETVT